jgi:hypothetical protein
MLIAFGASTFAQQKQKAGEIQVSLVLGNLNMFKQDLNYVMPKYSNTNENIGIGLSGTNSQSNDPGLYLNFNDIGGSSLLNIAGVQTKYYLSDNLDINVMFAMDLRSTPKKDYIEGDATIKDMVIQSSKYIEGRLSNNWMANIGSNYYFNTSSNRISFYTGVQGGFQMGRVQTMTPYTGSNLDDEDAALYVSSKKAGQVWCITGAIIGGAECNLAQGLVLGLEFAPFAYQYSMLEVYPTGMNVYQANHQSFRFFASPNLKLGFRF